MKFLGWELHRYFLRSRELGHNGMDWFTVWTVVDRETDDPVMDPIHEKSFWTEDKQKAIELWKKLTIENELEKILLS